MCPKWEKTSVGQIYGPPKGYKEHKGVWDKRAKVPWVPNSLLAQLLLVVWPALLYGSSTNNWCMNVCVNG